MKDSLDLARNVYHLLIVVSTISIFFGYSQKLIVNPYEYAMDEIANIEWDLRALHKAGKIAFQYEGGRFFIADSGLVHKMKNATAKLDSVEIMYKQRLFKGASQDSLFSFLKSYRQYVVDTDELLKRRYISDSVKVADLSYYSEKFFNRDLFHAIFSEHKSFKRIYTASLQMSVSDFSGNLGKKAEAFESTIDRSIDILGIRISISEMAIFIPLLPLSLWIYLLVILRHIAKVMRLNQDAQTLRDYPLLLFFNDNLSESVVVLSMFIPIFSSILIVGKSPGDSLLKDMLFFAYPGVFVFLLFSFRKLVKSITQRAFQDPFIQLLG